MTLVPMGIALVWGVAWALDYGLTTTSGAQLVLAHVLAGLALAIVLPRLARRECPRAPLLAVTLVSWLVFGAGPALVDALAPVTVALPARLLLVTGAALVCVAVGIYAARLGAVVALAVAVAPVVSALVLASPVPQVVPARRTQALSQLAPESRRVAVIGLDSGDWRVIDPLIARGELPNLAGLLARGSQAVLKSVEPTYSPVVWTSIFSGKSPEKHGITDWFVSHSANRHAVLLWEIVAAAGRSSIVMNVPGSWPPIAMQGALVSGFPIPGTVQIPGAVEAQYLGTVISATPRLGLVPTVQVTPAADGVLHAEIRVREGEPRARTRLRHYVIEWLIHRDLLPLGETRLRLRASPEPDTGGWRVETEGQSVELAQKTWSQWIPTRVFGISVYFRLRDLGGGRIYVTPLFQDPAEPEHPYASAPDLQRRIAEQGMYVVEGIGWLAATDPDLREAFFEHLTENARRHVGVLFAMVDTAPDWALIVDVITLTDRASHAFYRFHDPASYPPLTPEESAANPDRLVDAYRVADEAIGHILERLGDDVTVVVVSDHGSAADVDKGYGTHRIDGIFLAAGPGIAPSSVRGELSVYDVTPTVLALMGLPAAKDMDGIARLDLLDGVSAPPMIVSYEVESGDVGSKPTVIDASTEEQLRALGYIQ